MCSLPLNYGLKCLLSVTLIIFSGYMDAKPHNVKFKNQTDFLIDTDGCFIPNYMRAIGIAYLKETQNMKCKPRMVYIDRTYGDQFRFRIDEEAKRSLEAKHYQEFHQQFHCGYRILSLTSAAILSKVRVLNHGDTLDIDEDSIVLVTCTYLPVDLKRWQNTTNLKLYKDVYILFKKKDFVRELEHTARWNVLLFGIESMSRARAFHTMPVVVQYLIKHGWLDFRGHHLVSHYVLPNLMAILSGSTQLKPEKQRKSYFTQPSLLWKEFSVFEYVTAMGHDNTVKSKFHYNFEKLHNEYTTDHWFRIMPEFMKNSAQCFGRLPPGEHLLNYATQFVEAYRSINRNYFGFFFSGGSNNYDSLSPHKFQAPLIEFLEKIRRVGSLRNTFVFLFGGASGNLKTEKDDEDQYNDKLPMLFMWVPIEFRKMHPNHYRNVKENQYRFTNHYDLYATVKSILQLSEPVVEGGVTPECKTCTSLFKRVSLSRTCAMTQADSSLCACKNQTNFSEEVIIMRKIMDKSPEGQGFFYTQNDTKSNDSSTLDYK